jgi:putative ABC transport system permease protein
MMARSAPWPVSRLRLADTWSLAVLGLVARPARAALSAVGVALGIATMVAVLGVSGSSRAQLVAQIDALGTNLLTVAPGQSFGGQAATLPPSAPAMVARIGPVIGASAIGDVNAQVYRNDRISAANTNAITVYSTDVGLLRTLLGQLARGRFLDAATGGTRRWSWVRTPRPRWASTAPGSCSGWPTGGSASSGSCSRCRWLPNSTVRR